VQLIRFLGRRAENFGGQIDPSRLHVVGVEIDCGHDRVWRVFAVFRIADDLIVIDRDKLQAAVALQRDIFPANAIHPLD
jgi:hypothetical protein